MARDHLAYKAVLSSPQPPLPKRFQLPIFGSFQGLGSRVGMLGGLGDSLNHLAGFTGQAAKSYFESTLRASPSNSLGAADATSDLKISHWLRDPNKLKIGFKQLQKCYNSYPRSAGIPGDLNFVFFSAASAFCALSRTYSNFRKRQDKITHDLINRCV